MNKIALTIGDPNSISPEIVIKALNKLNLPEENIILIANKTIFDFYKDNYSLALEKEYHIEEIPYKIEDIRISHETKESGDFVFNALKRACELANTNKIQAIVTGPISKHSLNLAGHHYSGQTEIIEKYTKRDGQKAEMLFVMNKIRILLLTRHIALKDVPATITKDFLVEKIERLHKELQTKFKIKNPKIALCSLNPHAGEQGLFGLEEQKAYIPAINLLKQKGINIKGPFPSDGLFYKLSKEVNQPQYDCYVASYHDQGLIPVKLLGLDLTVNTTIGLDKLRTSPAHGTAFDIAGQLCAKENSMIEAIKLAIN